MSEDISELVEPDPLLASSRGNEAPLLGADPESSSSTGKWLGIAAGVGVGSAAVAAALLFWGKSDGAAKNAAAKASKSRRKKSAAARPEAAGE